MSRILSYSALALVPLAWVLEIIDAPPLLIFIIAAAAIAVSAEFIRRATEQLAAHLGPVLGGLLSISFGSIAELIVAVSVLRGGNAEVVHAQIAGSIMATSLLGLGLAIVIGSIRRNQKFDAHKAGILSTLLVVVLIALLLPAIFDFVARARGRSFLRVGEEELSLGVSIVLLLLYLANLVYTLVTRRDVFVSENDENPPRWSLATALGVVAGATITIAVNAELVSGTLTETAAALHLSPPFVGVVILALVGTIADLFAACWFAHHNRMGLVLGICIGSAIQVALVVAPLLVILSWLLHRPFSLVFANPLHLFAIAATALIINAVARDGEANWFEGLLLLGVYTLFGLAFFFV